MKQLRLFIQLARPIYLLFAVLLYVLGAGIARYLSGQVDWLLFVLGLTWAVLIYLGFQCLNEYFYTDSNMGGPQARHTPFSGVSGALGNGRLPRPTAFWLGMACLVVAATLIFPIVQNIKLGSTGILIIGLLLLAEFLLAVPPLRLVASGYGELIQAIITAALIPAWAFLLQGREFHRILLMVAFPLTTLYLGMIMALELPDYAADIKQGKKPMIIRLGWQRAMVLHNLLILVSFIILGIAFILGLPFYLGWPVFMVLPVGLFQIWMMNRIADGAKPNWNLLTLVAMATFGLAAYILAFAFWTH